MFSEMFVPSGAAQQCQDIQTNCPLTPDLALLPLLLLSTAPLEVPLRETVKLSNLPLAPPPPQPMQPPIHVETKTRLVALFAKRKHDFDNFYPAG